MPDSSAPDLHEPSDGPTSFAQISAVLTGLDVATLWGTGQVNTYTRVLRQAAGMKNYKQLKLYFVFYGLPITDPVAHQEALARLARDPHYGPMAQSIVQLWYLGSWTALPAEWHAQYGGDPNDTSRVVSVSSYPQSLVYTIAGAHPPGAKQPGFASWAFAPSSDLSNRSRHE